MGFAVGIRSGNGDVVSGGPGAGGGPRGELLLPGACGPTLRICTGCPASEGSGGSNTPFPQRCRQQQQALKLCKSYVSKKGMKFLNFLRQRRGGKKIDSLFSLAVPQDARQSWPPSCLMASSAFFLSLPLFIFPLLHLPPSYLYFNKTPLFSKSGSGSGLGLSLVLWRCCKAGIVSSFVVSGLLVSVSCFVRREGPGAGPVASFGSCEEVVKRGCGSRFWGVCCAVPLSCSQDSGLVTGRARPEPELEGNGRGWKLRADRWVKWAWGLRPGRLAGAGGSCLGGLIKPSATSPFSRDQQFGLCQPSTGQA